MCKLNREKKAKDVCACVSVATFFPSTEVGALQTNWEPPRQQNVFHGYHTLKHF